MHNLPVVSDLRSVFPEARIDWIVERNLSAIPGLHAGVRTVLPCALRHWRRRLFVQETWREIGELKQALSDTRYDAIVDTQGLLKSALVQRLACGRRHGLDWRSSREPLRLFYDQTHAVPWGRHAVERNRELAAKALGYRVPDQLDYGIEAPEFPPPAGEDDSPADEESPWFEAERRYAWVPDAPFAVLLHGTSAEKKLWPEPQWKKLVATLQGEGLAVVLPWGSVDERERARRIAKGLRQAHVPPRLGLRTLAGLLGKANVCFGVDTGLTHLAAALRRPTVGIYVATDPRATGVLAPGCGVNVGTGAGAPALAAVVSAMRTLL